MDLESCLIGLSGIVCQLCSEKAITEVGESYTGRTFAFTIVCTSSETLPGKFWPEASGREDSFLISSGAQGDKRVFVGAVKFTKQKQKSFRQLRNILTESFKDRLSNQPVRIFKVHSPNQLYDLFFKDAMSRQSEITIHEHPEGSSFKHACSKGPSRAFSSSDSTGYPTPNKSRKRSSGDLDPESPIESLLSQDECHFSIGETRRRGETVPVERGIQTDGIEVSGVHLLHELLNRFSSSEELLLILRELKGLH